MRPDLDMAAAGGPQFGGSGPPLAHLLLTYQYMGLP